MEEEFATRLKKRLSASEIKRQAIVLALIAQDKTYDVYYALAVNNVILEEALDLLNRMSIRVTEESRVSDMALVLLQQTKPHLDRGYKILRSASAGHEAVHGTPENKTNRWQEYMQDCVSVAKEHKEWNLKAIRAKVAIKRGVKAKTIERHTPNLRREIAKLKK